ncbi:hypothetical protein B0H15DRAFT_1021070 [Mycena belliarum]|uniref:Uncharacterized protein n=1 Tax=Mycena belliarum TaxID=1033014 RepID=A0AAD6XTT9_9AGAR|nr:hypothetical protein B0H15DRAFT_1021070 [Mycena belliae]
MAPRGTLRFAAFALVAVVVLSGFAYNALVSRSPLAGVDYFSPASEVEILALDHPNFADIRKYERTLPQHRLPTFMTKTRPRYVYFSNEAWGTGWNNVFQEQLINTHLAYLAHRGYVFPDYIARDHPPFPDALPNGTRHMLHIPMNAFTSGPTGGGELGAGADPHSPRAISLEWWDAVCPRAQVVEVTVADVVRELGITETSTGEERLMRWAAKLRDMKAECVTVIGGSPFDYMCARLLPRLPFLTSTSFVGSDRVVALWPSYGHSPTLTQHAWSALITRALSRNFALFSAADMPAALAPSFISRITAATGAGSIAEPYPLTAFTPLRTDAPPIAGLLGLHVRRGDFAEHCTSLAGWGSDYNAWNVFGRPDIAAAGAGRYPALPDHLIVPAGTARGDAAYAHCWPTPAAIVARAREVRTAAASGEAFPAQALQSVYIATNGEPEWVRALALLLQEDGWGAVKSSCDMRLARDEFAVAQAVDMAALVAAETFIGVGFSSLSSNVVQLRLAGGRHAATNRFW